MKYALYGPTGRRVTLREFLDKQGREMDPRKWTVQPCCPHGCGTLVAHDKVGALGVHTAGRMATDRQRPVVGFRHPPQGRPGAALPDCPYSFPNDERFFGLTKYTYSPKMKAQNLAVLNQPHIRRANKKVLKALLTVLYQRPPTGEDRVRLWKVGTKLVTMEVLSDHPWLLPYIIAMTERHQQRTATSRTGESFTYNVGYDDQGAQPIPYKDMTSQQTLRNEVVMRSLRLSFVKERNRIPTFEPVRNPVTQAVAHEFEVSKAAWMKLAGIMPAFITSGNGLTAHGSDNNFSLESSAEPLPAGRSKRRARPSHYNRVLHDRLTKQIEMPKP